MTDDEILKVVKAHKDGKQIQFDCLGEWKDTNHPSWDFVSNDYRIKPEPHYVPYDSVDEIDRGRMVHLKADENKGIFRQIVMIDRQENRVVTFSMVGAFNWRSLGEMFNNWEYEDGTPFGKLVSE